MMFSFFKKDPIKKLDEQYSAKLEEAMMAQRKGDIQTYSELTAEAEVLANQLRELKESIQG